MVKNNKNRTKENPAQIYELANGELVQLLSVSQDLLTGDTFLSVLYGKEDKFKNFTVEQGRNVKVTGVLIDIPSLLHQL